MFALVDCNSFYASCEQIFRPDLRGKPVVVLSNNDGFVVARSKEAKDLNIPDLTLYIKVAPILRKHKVAVFSSNYPLYGDMSSRVMSILREYSPQVEVYSIDEMFLELEGMNEDLTPFGQTIKKRIWKETRLPVCVGFGSTKTLAKVANHGAKKIPALNGVCWIQRDDQRQWLLQRMPVNKVWGIGSRIQRKLNELDINTAWDLATADARRLRRRFSVNLERTIAELNGEACYALEEVPPAKKQIYCTRGFGVKAVSLPPIIEAISLYASRAAEKLREQSHLATTLHVFIQTSPYDRQYYSRSTVVQLPYPTDDTRIISRYAQYAAKSLYLEGYSYLKAGVGIIEMVDRKFLQSDLFSSGQAGDTDKLMSLLDGINRRFGRDTLQLAGEGVQKKWYMRQAYRSPSYTTRISDLPIVNI
ncbi:Y-family DNA polymerase [Zhongshania marina]|uniref:UMUC domain-containing protein DNA-repair protein n=1 Tax=Zhongshania marina TaxID=2304603 RepID=A0A2S4HF99_9GAMM|nr:Y-family DNA polymerase [Marortus luteolus]POP52609.1 UMUC domain-containing protein DNA-repair protein [Marortus luteolus]